jgi:uncharacterized SAM-binding protein YcdF (DUF218 family)
LIDTLLNPLTWVLGLLALLMGLLLRRRARIGWGPGLVCLASFALLALASSPLVATALLETLERGQAPLNLALDPPPEAIVVLGAGFDALGAPRPELNGAARARLMEGVRLARDYPGSRLVLSGGGVDQPRATQAELMAGWAVHMGLAPERIAVEARSGTTRGNAVETAALARREGWTRLVLVTSASHMPRSLAAFRAVGLEPIPAPCNFTDLKPFSLGWFLPKGRALRDTSRAIHEIVGSFWYGIRGWA